jgi:hypothetical protein
VGNGEPRGERGAGRPSSLLEQADSENEDAEGQPVVQELIRRMANLGLSSFFTTESAVRKALGETVPK